MAYLVPSVLWCCWLGGRNGIRWWGAGLVICLERGADLHMAQLMPLPLIVSCFSKIQIDFTFLVLTHQGSPGQRAIKHVCVCVCVSICLSICFQSTSVTKWTFTSTFCFTCMGHDLGLSGNETESQARDPRLTWRECVLREYHGWLGSRVVSVLDSGSVGSGFKSQSRCCRVTVLGKLFTPIVPLFTKQRNS